MLFKKTTPTTMSSSMQYNQSTTILNPTQTVRPATASNFQFVNTSSTGATNTVRPIIFHQKPTTTSTQPQLLTVMPAGVRVQQLTPVVRGSSTQPTTIVRLMSPATTNVRPGIGQQQFIHLNTNKQQHPLVIKAIAAQTANRQQQQQQPMLLAANSQQKTMTPQSQQQVLVLNQNTFSTSSGQHPQFTLQMTNFDQKNSPSVHTTTNVDNGQQEPTIPQLDGSVDDQVNIFLKFIIIFSILYF